MRKIKDDPTIMQKSTATLLEKLSVHAWIQQHGILTETGQPLDFRDHMYLFDPYRDYSPKQVILKGAQIGFSTLAILKTLWISAHKKLDIIYILPTANDVKDFVGGKTNRMISQNPILQQYTADKDSIEQKQVLDNVIYYRGSWTERSALMISADLVVMDEFDRCKQEILEQYSSRLQHSKYGWQWVFSNPSVPDMGVHKYWQLSDQKHWFIKCPACKEEQYLDWPESVNMETQKYICKECGAELSDRDRARGRWRKKYKDREWSGYWINLMMVPRVPASKVIEYYKTKSPEYFANFVLGLPYVGSGNKVSQDMIYKNLTPKVNSQDGRIVIGVDTGIDIRYVIGNSEGIFYYGQCKNYDDLDGFMQRWDRAVMVIDQGGDIIGSRLLREKYPGRVFLCHYAVDRKTLQLVRWGQNDETGNVVVDRNRMIQLVIDEFTDKRIPLQGDESDWYDYWLHWSHIYRVGEEDNLGVTQYKWLRSDRDDWVHATVYWRAGMDRFGQAKGELIGAPTVKFTPAQEITPDGKMRIIVPTQVKNHDWRDA